jgi:hypothetical protein
MGRKQKPTPEKYCETCTVRLVRRRMPNGDLEDLPHFNLRRFCSLTCFGKSLEKDRSTGNWSTAHSMARRKMPPGPCARCGKPDAIDVHHRNGDPQDNRLSNLERICRSCHNREHKQRASCTVCGLPAKGHGYCNVHYIRWKKHGDPLAIKTPIRKACSTCGLPAQAQGLCGRHYMQAKRALPSRLIGGQG